LVKVIRLPIEKTLWDLWDLLEREGVKDVWIDMWTPSDDPFSVVVEIYKDEARILVPEGVLKSESLMDLMGLFAEAYRGYHLNWERVVREDYEFWLEDLKRIWIESGMPPEEAEKKKQEMLKALEETIKRETRELKAFADFAKSLFELLYPKKKPKKKQ
jgi:hypothetical protein